MAITPLNTLPVVIDRAGDYVTRGGSRVTIRTITAPAHNDLEVTAFRAKGSVWKLFRGTPRPVGLNIWHVSGRLGCLSLSPLDIVGYWNGEQSA